MKEVVKFSRPQGFFERFDRMLKLTYRPSMVKYTKIKHSL